MEKRMRRDRTPRDPGRPRERYERPVVESEQMFDTSALACGMCVAGPFPQFACGNYPRYD